VMIPINSPSKICQCKLSPLVSFEFSTIQPILIPATRRHVADVWLTMVVALYVVCRADVITECLSRIIHTKIQSDIASSHQNSGIQARRECHVEDGLTSGCANLKTRAREIRVI
jgi:hypothetical protein